MRLSELLNREVVTESGRRLGQVHDVRGELAGGHLRVTGLVAGKLGILERYGVGTHGSGGPRQAKVHGHPVIPWEHVVRVGSQVVVRDEVKAVLLGASSATQRQTEPVWRRLRGRPSGSSTTW